jgi:predicted O-methyltransferase YrrM
LGFSTIVMARPADLVVAVDHHRGDPDAGFGNTLPAFLENLQRYEVADCVIPLIADMEIAVPLLPDAYFGLVFLDASHDRLSVARDIAVCWPKLAPGGVFAFHDYGRFEVAGPVDALGYKMTIVDSLAWLLKK